MYGYMNCSNCSTLELSFDKERASFLNHFFGSANDLYYWFSYKNSFELVRSFWNYNIVVVFIPIFVLLTILHHLVESHYFFFCHNTFFLFHVCFFPFPNTFFLFHVCFFPFPLHFPNLPSLEDSPFFFIHCEFGLKCIFIWFFTVE